MRYASIRKMDIINGQGIGVSIFFQGCPFHCKGCFNQETWDFNGGKEFTKETKDKFIELCNKPYISFIAILGGEPLVQGEDLYLLLKEIKEEFPDKKIFLWSGFVMEDVIKDETKNNIIQLCDTFIDGRYIEDLRDLNLKLRGSKNQRIWVKDSNNNWILSQNN